MHVLILEDRPCPELTTAVSRRIPDGQVRRLPPGRDPAGVVRDTGAGLVLLGPSLADHGAGVPIVHAVVARHPAIPIVAVSEQAVATTAVALVKAGATDWLPLAQLADALPALLDAERPRRHAPRRAERRAPDAPRLIGDSHALEAVRHLVRTAAQSEAPVLIEGETGTGKEVVAQSVHRLGRRSAAAFVPLNCAAIPESLAESEFFGHARGAFTGAVQDRPGALQLAHGGTLFLDEIEDMPSLLQAKLLRAVQDQEIRPLGATTTRRVDVRLVAASNRDLRALVDAGIFRSDLYYRLRVLTIRLPALRERREDILPLAAHFVARFNAREGTGYRLPPPHRCRPLLEHAWPGNVRELENTLESLLITARAGGLDLGDVVNERTAAPEPWLDERGRILRVLEEHRWNRQRTAAALGISRVTLWRRMERHNIRDPLVSAAAETH